MGCKKGERAVNASRSGGGRALKGGQAAPPSTFDCGHMTLKAPGQTRCPARQHYRSVSMQPCQGTNPVGRLLMLGRRVTGGEGGHHLPHMHRALWEFCHSLHTSFPCLDNHMTVRTQEDVQNIMYFKAFCLKRYLFLKCFF